MKLEVTALADGALLGDRIEVASTFWRRFRGLLGRDVLARGEGLCIERCRSIHMMGMKFPLDVIFLDADNRITALRMGLQPGEWLRAPRHTVRVLELPTGTIHPARVIVGSRLLLRPVP
jgi:uncharacterized membrane protein (UPF0127 family)